VHVLHYYKQRLQIISGCDRRILLEDRETRLGLLQVRNFRRNRNRKSVHPALDQKQHQADFAGSKKSQMQVKN
jgi:hypothetical protein